MTLIFAFPAILPTGNMQQAQLLMLAGFVVLGWVLVRRQIRMRRRVNGDAQAANKAIAQIRDYKDPAMPLSDAPPETQRWQAAMFDLQRELKAELDTRIVVVQTLMQQIDQRIERLTALQSALAGPARRPTASSDRCPHRDLVEPLWRSGRTASEIASETGLPLGDVERAISLIGTG